MSDLPWQFGPGSPLDVDLRYVTVGESPISSLGDSAILKGSKKSLESELEWQWIIDQQQTCKCEWFSSNKFENNHTRDGPGSATVKEDGLRIETDSSTSSLFSGSRTEGSSDAGTSKLSTLSVEINAVKQSHRDVAEWRTANSKELAALVSQKGQTYLENCDLPSSQSSLSWKGPLSSCNLTSSKDIASFSSPADRASLTSMLSRQESTFTGKPASTGSCGLQHTLEHCPCVSQPQPVHCSLPWSSAYRRSEDQVAWKMRNRAHKHELEALGEALCHSQTRAREAEKMANKVLQEREKLTGLLFRESWTAHTYKQWVQTLEMENLLLKMSYGSDMEWLGSELSDICSLCGINVNPLKHPRKNVSQVMGHNFSRDWVGNHRKHGCASESSVWLRCTIGLAFALGLSFAGAGLVIGWSMGWILLSH
ncbi:hypothetical protein KP509_14G074000 [Ceratopteris richardii]|nr:hypothetical protein KP509_14G074000 [Ceratopteris richardii]